MAFTAQFEQFQAICKQAGISPTHQRLVIWQTMMGMHNHPRPEDVYASVKPQLPTVSLATVYKNIHVFVEAGVFREVSPHYGSVRVETNPTSHPHMVCRKCRSIFDLDPATLGILPVPQELPGGFVAERYSIDVLGVCTACQKQESYERNYSC